MKTTLPRQDFQDALAAVATVTGGRTTKPILACVKLCVEGERLELSGTDGEAALRTSVPCLAVEQAGEVVVTAERLLSIVREMGDVEIALEADERQCVIRGEGSEFKVYALNPADFPPLPEFDGDADLVMEGALLWRMIGLTLYAAARETSRYAINGVLWEKTGKRLFLVATDGRRLARSGGPVAAGTGGDFEVIIPSKALTVFERVFSRPKDDGEWRVEVKVTPNQVLLRSGTQVLSSVLVEGHFPKYDDVIPKESDKRARIGRDELHSAVRRAALLTTEDSRAVRLSFNSEQLVITAQSPEQGEARVELPIQYEGEPLDIGFNPAFLGDVLKVLPYEEVFCELHESFRPGVVCGEDKTEFLYVLMPVSLSA